MQRMCFHFPSFVNCANRNQRVCIYYLKNGLSSDVQNISGFQGPEWVSRQSLSNLETRSKNAILELISTR